LQCKRLEVKLAEKLRVGFQVKESHAYGLVPIAWLEEVFLRGSENPDYLFTLDLSAGMGSYAGPTTYLYEIVGGTLKAVEYVDNGTKKNAPLVLMRSLKTNWKLVKSNTGKVTDILHVSCRPDNRSSHAGAVQFLVYYDRFHFDGKTWIKYQRVEHDFWEAEGEELPPLAKFPVSSL